MEAINEKCGHCLHLTNVFDSDRPVDNVMGGCFIDGHITFTDCKACNNFKLWEGLKNNSH